MGGMALYARANAPKESDPPPASQHEHYKKLEVDFENGGFKNDKYLPFDVPFYITGYVPENVYRVAIIYGPAEAFQPKKVTFSNGPIKTAAKKLKEEKDLIGSISIVDQNDLRYAIWDKPNLKIEYMEDNSPKEIEPEKFALEIVPLKANEPYHFFLQFYASETDPETKAKIEGFLARRFEDEAFDLLEDVSDPRKKLQTSVFLDAPKLTGITTELNTFLTNQLHLYDVELTESLLKDFTTLESYLNQHLESYKKLRKYHNQFETKVNESSNPSDNVVNSQLIEVLFNIKNPDKSLIPLIEKLKKLEAEGEYRNGFKNFVTGIEALSTRLSLYSVDEVDLRIENLKAYIDAINHLTNSELDILSSAKGNYGVKLRLNTRTVFWGDYDLLEGNIASLEKANKSDKQRLENLNHLKTLYGKKASLTGRIQNAQNKQYNKKISQSRKLALRAVEITLVEDLSLVDANIKALEKLLSRNGQNGLNAEINWLKKQITANKKDLDKKVKQKATLDEFLKTYRVEADAEIGRWKQLLKQKVSHLQQAIAILEECKTIHGEITTEWKTRAGEMVETFDFGNFYQLAGLSGADYVSRADYYISADIGMAYLSFQHGSSAVAPYLGANFNLFPINRESHYNLFTQKHPRSFNKIPRFINGISFMVGFTYIKLPFESNRTSLFPSSGSLSDISMLTGFSLRTSDHSRITFGYSWTYYNPTPGFTDTRQLSLNPFISLSIDYDVRSRLKGIGSIFKSTKLATDVEN